MLSQEVIKELLRSMRGKRSQQFINKRLGRSFNQCYRWESGYTNILWPDFVAFAAICKVNVQTVLKKWIFFQGDPANTHELVLHIVGQFKLSGAPASLGISRFTLHRWTKGKATPTLLQMLQLIRDSSPVLLDILGEMTDARNLPSLADLTALQESEKNLTYDLPWTGAVLRCFEIKDYLALPVHQEGFVSRKIGISLAEEHMTLAKLQQAGVIAWVGGKYVSRSHNLDTRSDFLGNNRVRTYWARKTLDYVESLQAPPELGAAGYNVYSVGPKSYAEIMQRYLEFYNEVRRIVETETETPEMIQLLQVSLLNLPLEQTHKGASL